MKLNLQMMRIFLISFLCILGMRFEAKSQTRFFEFTTACGTGNWKDSSFIAATSDPVLIDTVLANLARPDTLRKFIIGSIDYGNGGFNHNATHWFSWHFINNQWSLADLAIEGCDGCPYTDVELDMNYWVAGLGQFCPWTAKPTREVADPLGNPEMDKSDGIRVFPNPTVNTLHIERENSKELTMVLLNSLGEEIFSQTISSLEHQIDISYLASGLYFLQFQVGTEVSIRKVMIERKD